MEKVGSSYRMVILAAKRALELSNGFPKLVEAGPKEKAPMVALKEIAAGKVTFKIKKKSKES